MLFDLTARHPGEVVTTTDLARELEGLTRHQVAGRLQGLTKIIQEVAGTEYWPLNFPKATRGEFGYSMDPEIAAIWLQQPGMSAPRVWIEKTITKGRRDRLGLLGEKYSLGHALWSPKTSRTGADVYRFMREVQPGDTILHLTDNEAFTGISRAAGPARDASDIPPNTTWSDRECLTVPLEDYRALEPPLTREQFFASPYRERFQGLIDEGQKNLFFDRKPALHQGAYLTPCPPALLDILVDAYRQVADQDLLAVTPSTGYYLSDLANKLNVPESWLEDIQSLLKRKRQVIFYGPPGTGKTFIALKLARCLARAEDRVRIVQFHPAYSYEDFMEGYRPDKDSRGSTFTIVDGPLKKIANDARKDRGHTYILLIDEINRGNLAKVFGEAYFLLEYRVDRIKLLYSSGDFNLPDNLWIIGTMNTADRSIALLDAALRRRFFFVPFFAGEWPISDVLGKWLRANKPDLLWVDRLVKLANARLGDPNLAIGPSYFIDQELDESWVKRIWQHAVIPYLQEQFFDEPDQLASFAYERLAIEAKGETSADAEKLSETATA
jgi:hypothetical protein